MMQAPASRKLMLMRRPSNNEGAVPRTFSQSYVAQKALSSRASTSARSGMERMAPFRVVTR